jgi:hypothetical protein
MEPTPESAPISYPPGDYAIVELLGHTTLVGRVAEVERFGTKMLAIEALFQDTLLPAVFQGGASIYRFTPCSAEIAFKQQPRHGWQLPSVLQAIVPPTLLPATAIDVHEDQDDGHHDPDDEDDRPF